MPCGKFPLLGQNYTKGKGRKCVRRIAARQQGGETRETRQARSELPTWKVRPWTAVPVFAIQRLEPANGDYGHAAVRGDPLERLDYGQDHDREQQHAGDFVEAAQFP